MRDDLSLGGEKVSSGRLFLPSLVISYFATGPLAVLIGFLLRPIADTFGVSLGTMGQISTLSSAVAVIFALLMGALSVRHKHKSLLMIGLLFMSLSSIGCFLAPDFTSMLVSYSLSGAGLAMITPMTMALVGERFPLEKRAKAVGWIIAGGSLAYLIGAPIIALIADIGGWRSTLPGFVIPFSLVSLLLAYFGISSASRNRQSSMSNESYSSTFKEILSNRSAAACLVGDVLRSAAFSAILFYGASFFIDRFKQSTDFASVVILGAALCYTLGSVISGSLVNKFGRKPLAVSTAFLASIFTISFVYVSNLWLSLALNFVASWFFGMVASASNSLTLEQVPKLRGTMMSIDAAAINMGYAIGAAVGGKAHDLYNYEGAGSILGATGIVAAIVFYLLTIDPARKEIKSSA